ncbi:MAG: LbtU family siderophore porin [Thermodesulfobacteriota bacterium]|nr:LbtU family siderophore porin [Thermodesulfobacteriota bacterium]
MRKFLLMMTVCLVTSMMLLPYAFARDLSNYELLERITKLEDQLAEQSDKSAPEPLLGSWAERITLSGLIEAEVGYEKIDFDDPSQDDEDSSDITLATVELGVDVAITKYVSGSVLLLWEEGEGDVDVDEAFILLDGEDDLPMFLRAGKIYLPFGDFTSNMISDPLTLELGETSESALEIGFEEAGFYGSVYVFNGDIDEEGKDSHIDNFGAKLGYTLEQNDFTMDAGVCYINNLIDSDSWGDTFEEMVADAEDNGDTLELRDYVDGFGAHIVIGVAGFTLIGEYVGAMDDPEYLVNGVKTTGDAISTWNTEMGYTFEAAGKETTVGLAYQGSDDGGEFLPESRYVGVVSSGIMEYTTLSLEYLHDKYENDAEVDVITAQLAIEF